MLAYSKVVQSRGRLLAAPVPVGFISETFVTSLKPILLPYQRQWIADRAAVKVYEKSRRIGITWAESADAALDAGTRSGSDWWYIGYNKEMALEFVEAAAGWAGHFNQAVQHTEEIMVADPDRDILAYRIRFSSGHKIVALSSSPSNLRGKQGVAIIDEAAFHHDLPELLKAALALTIWGGRVHVISTHNGPLIHSTNSLETSEPAGGRIRFIERHSTTRWRRVSMAQFAARAGCSGWQPAKAPGAPSYWPNTAAMRRRNCYASPARAAGSFCRRP